MAKPARKKDGSNELKLIVQKQFVCRSMEAAWPLPRNQKNSKFDPVMFFRKHLGFIFGFGVAAVALAVVYLSTRPLIPLDVQEQIDADIEKCGGLLKEQSVFHCLGERPLV